MNKSITILLIIVSTAVAADKPYDEPQFTIADMRHYSYGCDRDVKLLAGLGDDTDPLVRQAAATDLGKTNNPTAMVHIRKAWKDSDEAVRRCAMSAAVNLDSAGALDIVIQALGDPDSRMILQALQCVRRAKLTGAAKSITPLLSSDDPFIVAVSLKTLTHLRKAVDGERLAALLLNAHVEVRLRAAENAILCFRPSGELIEALLEQAQDDVPAVRAACLSALGKLNFNSARGLIRKAQRDKNPLVRKGALLAHRNAGQIEKNKKNEKGGIKVFLSDSSALVRLAAAKAAGELKCDDCVEDLFKILFEAPYNGWFGSFGKVPEPSQLNLHFAARQSLTQLQADAVIAMAAKHLKRLAPKLISTDKWPRKFSDKKQRRKLGLLRRNVSACCYLLGIFKSTEAIDTQLSLLTRLPVDSPPVYYIANSLGQIGDRRAIEPLRKTLEICRKNGLRCLIAASRLQPAPCPHRALVTAAIIRAMGGLRDYEALESMIATGLVHYGPGAMVGGEAGLSYPTQRQTLAEILPLLARPDNRLRIVKIILRLLSESEGKMTQYQAAKSAVKIKTNQALPLLSEMLDNNHSHPPLMYTAAWAIERLSSKHVNIPNPKPNSTEQWIIREIEGI